MPQYYIWFVSAVLVFVLFSFARTYAFWKRVLAVEDILLLSDRDQKEYEKFRTDWPHDKLAIQKIFEIKLMLGAFGVILLISIIVYILIRKW